ncbi:MAG: acyl-CoA thioesterase [Hahellaceae bacterium]|nr:acyl-CoA thioesterase [Hahellaceae bacterium]MCP5210712.1 acyl-CoA thioesterase [Hahellaceae bacterium]
MRHSEPHPAPKGELIQQIIPLPQDTNANGDIYAGWLVNHMDLAASNMAHRISSGRTATVAIESMEFISPVRLGARVAFYGQLMDIGRSSMKVKIEVWTRDDNSNHPRKVTEALFVSVAIDKQGRIREVPDQPI